MNEDSYRINVIFPSGSELTTTVGIAGLVEYLKMKEFGYSVKITSIF